MLEMEAGQYPEWRDISDWGAIYKSYWALWKSLAVRDGMLEHDWESADVTNKMAQIVLVEMHGGTSRGHLGTNKTIDKVWQCYY